MNRLIIGTAGHIDHGKTSIIKALTSFEGDGTPEEKRRGITIELSFSSMKNGDKEISFIDVPGHEKLVKTMIGGAFGFDYALVVIDAFEGVKAQTIEHLLILDSLKPIGVIAVLSKSDLVSEEQINERKDEVYRLFDEYKNLKLLEIVPVSTKNPQQIDVLKECLFALKSNIPDDSNLPRLYIDRSFAIAGAGCVVTGTLMSGQVRVKDTLFIPNLQKSVKVKSIQTHGASVEYASCGQRTAINLCDISHNEVKKGMLLSKKGFLRGFRTIDVVIFKNKSSNIKHASELSLCFGTLSCSAKILILSENDEKIFASLEFDKDMYLVYGEPFIVRNSSHTLGGGIVVSSVADPIKKAQKEKLLAYLDGKDIENAFRMLVEIHRYGFGLICSHQRFGVGHEAALAIAHTLIDVIIDEKALVVYPKKTLELLKIELKKIYTKNKMALLSPTSLKHKLVWASEHIAECAFAQLETEGLLALKDGLYSLEESKNLDIWQELSSVILEILNSPDFAPPAPHNIYDEMDLDANVGDEILKKLCSSQKAVRLAHNHFISTSSLGLVLQKIREQIKKDGYATVASIKESLAISRKYAVNYLEYLDRFDDIENIEQKRVFKNENRR